MNERFRSSGWWPAAAAFLLLGFALLAPVEHPRAAREAFAADTALPAPAPKDKCPVCGMFVAKYPDFVAAVRHRDGSVFYFDGAKDLFKYYFNVPKYHKARSQKDILSVLVTDYYSLSVIDGLKAYYVAGSDVYGPMGKELIPFGNEADAKAFMVDHVGKALYRFPDINDGILKTLE